MQFCFVHPLKTKIASVVFSSTLVAADADEHEFCGGTCTEIKVGFQKQKKEGFCPDSEVLVHQKIVSTQRFLVVVFLLSNFSFVFKLRNLVLFHQA
jgi:hypothetical protein